MVQDLESWGRGRREDMGTEGAPMESESVFSPQAPGAARMEDCFPSLTGMAQLLLLPKGLVAERDVRKEVHLRAAP